jgi:hypothetical protein
VVDAATTEQEAEALPPDEGRLIVAVGIPGSGKSAVFRRLGRIRGLRVFCEPEERDWRSATKYHQWADQIAVLSWFRSIRVAQLYRAAALRRKGAVVLLDNYYDKLVYEYLGKPGIDRLISPRDSYYRVFRELARIDRASLPDADCLVFFEVAKDDWEAMLDDRDNRFDRVPGFSEIYEAQIHFYESAQRYCRQRGIPLVCFANRRSGADAAARELLERLKETSIVI